VTGACVTYYVTTRESCHASVDMHDETLRTHIRERLLGYALKHLTTNYIAFTETAVSSVESSSHLLHSLTSIFCYQLLQPYLFKISPADPHSLTLPVDPFETLSQSLGLTSLKRYGEDWTADLQTILYIKHMHSCSGQLRTERCFFEADQREYAHPSRIDTLSSLMWE
jgi:hypothetical protein